ncbi:MAG: UDP-N-acetylmuramoyl-L-alanyl-D-glutamate--2,6-diaminopimelate ligase [Parcubacteria group bacterium]
MQALKKLIPQSIKNIYHLIQAMLANFMYGFPSKSIKVIGVTGTNGKTTTVQMVAKILEEAGKNIAMASTINFKIGEREWKNISHFTTLSPFVVQKFILEAVKARCEYLVLETSSHSLDQYRVWGVDYKTAVITNATREHLDYHRTMDKYRRVKQKLFKKTETAIVNADMEKPEDFLRFDNKNKIIYSAKNSKANVFAADISLNISSSEFLITNIHFKLNLPGDFNIENALAAISVGVSENISLETCAKALEKIKTVPGRMEYIENNKNLNILVDFALTPDALEKLYALLMKTKKPGVKIIAVFGSCGERDRGKRPIMGEIVSRYADFVVVANDEPYHENPARIIREITAGIKNKKEGVSLLIIPDRREAIRKALQLGKADDIIAVTGMGAEESMVVGDQKIPWDDRKVIRELLQELK